jgi:hypothetical protein
MSTLRLYAQAARQLQVWCRAARLGLAVGLLQAALNQGDHWYHHRVDTVIVAKTALALLISFSLAFVSAVSTHVELQRRSSLSSS